MTNSINPPQDLPIEAIYGLLNDFPALLWRIEIRRARIEFLNNNLHVAPGVDGTLLLKNLSYRSQTLLPDDFHLIESFMDSVKEGKTAAIAFRVKNKENGISWIKLTGALNQQDPEFYYGYLLNVDDTVSIIRGTLRTDIDLTLMTEDVGNPIFVINYDSRAIIAANDHAKVLLGITAPEFDRVDITTLMKQKVGPDIEHVLSRLPQNNKWTGELTLHTHDKSRLINANATFRYLIHQETRLVRISLTLTPSISKKTRKLLPAEGSFDLTKEVSDLSDINAIMTTCLKRARSSKQFEAILFSDVHVRKNKVVVYGAGKPFSSMTQSDSFSFKGTIAEDIDRYNLEYLIVDDTQDSIKPIDWVLFVPSGIRSYFAMPFYSRSVLKTVIILCSTKPRSFTDKTPEDFSEIFGTMNQAVKAWRRNKRS